MNLTQKEVCDLTGINENTMRRIENGKVLPKQETLDLLSSVYKLDVSQVFLACRMDNFGEYSLLMEEIEKAFEASNPWQLKECLNELSNLFNSDMNQFYKNILQQTIHIIEAGIASLEDRDYNLSYTHIIKGLKVTIDQFNYGNYKDHVYNKLELQLLMNLAVTENARNNVDIALQILDFCVSVVENETELKKSILPTKIYLNASYMNYLNNQYEKSLLLANKGIEFNVNARSQYAIGHLYARKGFAELKLNIDEYIVSFRKALFFHDVLEQHDLKELLVKILKEKEGIDISYNK